MSESYNPSTQRTALLYLFGFIYGLTLAAILLWTAAFLLIFIALGAQQSNVSFSHHVDKSTHNYLARMKRALHWQSEFVPTPRTFQIAESIMFVYCFAFFAIALMSPYSLADLSWSGWVFVEHTAAIGIALLAAFGVVIVWRRRLPKGQSWPQACYRCFLRKDSTS